MDSTFATPAQVADILGVSVKTVIRTVPGQIGPSGKRRYMWEDVLKVAGRAGLVQDYIYWTARDEDAT